LELSSGELGVSGGRRQKKKYVLKKLRNNWYNIKREAGAWMACEVKLLKGLAHSNIAKLRGTVGQPGTGTFGLLLDKPAMMLEEQLTLWKKRPDKCRGRFGVLGREFGKMSSLLTERRPSLIHI